MRKSILCIVLIMVFIGSSMITTSQASAWTPLEYEPNNAPDTAFEIKSNSTLKSTISSSNDIDYYNFSVTGAVYTTITLVSPENIDYDIKLFDEGYNEIGKSSLSANNTDIISKDMLATGIYSIKVYNFNKKSSDMQYTLSIQTGDINGQNLYSFEGVPETSLKNINMTNALEINANGSFIAQIARLNEARYYKFKLDTHTDMEISMIPPEGVDFDIKLYNKLGFEVGSSSNKEGIEKISKGSLIPGVYFLKVYGYNYSFSPDTFKVSMKSQKTDAQISAQVIKEIAANTGIVKDKSIKQKINAESKDVKNSKNNTNEKEYNSKNNTKKDDTYSKNTDTTKNKSEKENTDLYEIPSVDGSSSNSDIKLSVPKALLLYVGPGLPKFTDDDINKLLVEDPINTKEFVITENGPQYNTYIDEYGNVVDIVSPEKIDKLTSDMVDSTGKIEKIKEDYKKLYSSKSSKNRTLDYFAKEVTDLAIRLIKKDPSVKLSIAIPGVSFHAFAYEYVAPVKEKLLKGIKERLDKENPEYWEKNIRGFYFSTEAIPYFYTWFKPDKTIDFNNPIVKTMMSYSEEIHNVYNKEFMWIPYYGNSLGDDKFYNKDQFARIGYIANRTNLFDYVFIQPTYYFKPASENISFVKRSTELNSVTDIKNEIIGGIKLSNTIIGPEMEIDSNCKPVAGKEVTAQQYKERYNEYVKAFSTLKSNTPVAFYAGSRNSIFTDTVYDEVKSFFKSIQ